MSKLLLVIDMQNDFIDGVMGSADAQAIVPKVVEKIKNYQCEDEVMFTLDTHYLDYLNTQEGKNLPIEHCLVRTEGWYLNKEVLEAVQGRPDAWHKNTFGCISLAEYLAEKIDEDDYNTIDEIEIVGLVTDICVISNALLIKAFCPEILITVDASCCAGTSLENHKNALKAMKQCQINIINE